MLILNLVLQKVALVYKTMSKNIEILFNKANTLKKIHKAAEKSL